MSAPTPTFTASGPSAPTASIEMDNIHPRRDGGGGALTSHPVFFDEPPANHSTLGVSQPAAAAATAAQPTAAPRSAGARPAVGRPAGTHRVRTDAVVDTRPTGFLSNLENNCFHCTHRDNGNVRTVYAAIFLVLFMSLLALVFVILILRY